MSNTISFQFDSIHNLDTKLLLALRELQQLRNDSTTTRMIQVRDSILDMCNHPKKDMDIEAAQFVIHPGRDKCNFVKLRRELGEDAKRYISTGQDSIWVQGIDLSLINDELAKRGEIES